MCCNTLPAIHIRAVDTTPAHITPKPPVSLARRRPDGSWYVDTTWQNGRREQLGRYESAVEAESYIKDQLQAWHDGQRRSSARPLVAESK